MNLEKIISTAFLVPMGDPLDPLCNWGLNVMLWGDPGIGKSRRVETASLSVGLPAQVIYAATSQPEDVSGTAFPDGKGGATILSLLPGIKRLMEDKAGVLFLDELSCARPAVQAAFLAVPLTRRVGDQILPPGVRVIAAGNPPESAAGGWELEPPMANRFCHIDVKPPTVEEWTDWLLNGEIPLETIEHGEQRVKDGWQNAWPIVKGIMKGFLQTNPGCLHTIPKEGDRARGRSWPSPRTWEFAARAYATCLCLKVDKITTMAFVEGCVGEGVAIAFASWVQNADLPDPLDVLQNGWEIDKKRLDRCLAVYTSMVAYVTGRQDPEERKKLAVLAWNRLAEGVQANLTDLVFPMANTLVRCGLDTQASQEIAEAAQPVMVRLAKGGYGQYLPGRP